MHNIVWYCQPIEIQIARKSYRRRWTDQISDEAWSLWIWKKTLNNTQTPMAHFSSALSSSAIIWIVLRSLYVRCLYSKVNINEDNLIQVFYYGICVIAGCIKSMLHTLMPQESENEDDRWTWSKEELEDFSTGLTKGTENTKKMWFPFDISYANIAFSPSALYFSVFKRQRQRESKRENTFQNDNCLLTKRLVLQRTMWK